MIRSHFDGLKEQLPTHAKEKVDAKLKKWEEWIYSNSSASKVELEKTHLEIRNLSGTMRNVADTEE